MKNENIKTVILDLDGVIYREGQPIPHADKAIELLRKAEIEVFFLTNAASRSRKERAEYLKKFNIITDVSHTYTSSYTAAKYIHEHLKNARVFYVGGSGIGKELFIFGIPIIEHFYANVVIVSMDKSVTYSKLDNATYAINRGATFIATNRDVAFISETRKKPGAGALVSFVETATGVKPIVLGKPNPYMLNYIIKEHKLKKENILMVGDNLHSDIEMANNMGIRSALVLSGLHQNEDIKKNRSKPNFIYDDLYKLALDLTGNKS